MNKVTDISTYPWLCPSSATLADGSDNIVCDNERDTVDDVTLDAYGLAGIKCVFYKVHQDLQRDRLWGEDQLKQIMRSWYFMGYIQQLPPNVRTYQLQGIWGEDVITMYASIAAFNYYSTYGGEDKNTPEEYDVLTPQIDDIIYIPANDTFYRIHDVKYYSEAFGLAKHTYTLTLKVYKDNKWTVSADSPTLSNMEDPIYKVAPYPMSAQYNYEDPLKINSDLEENKTVNMYDSRYVSSEDKTDNPAYYDPFGGW